MGNGPIGQLMQWVWSWWASWHRFDKCGTPDLCRTDLADLIAEKKIVSPA